MGTNRTPIPPVQKLLAPLRERESSIQSNISKLKAALEAANVELADVHRKIFDLLDWVPPHTLANLYEDGRLKQQLPSVLNVVDAEKVDDENEEEDSPYECFEEEEQEEAAPEQPDDPLSASIANEGENVFEVLNAAMAVLRREHSKCATEGEHSGKRKMSLLDRCFFDVREYMGRLVASLPPAGSDRAKVPAVLPKTERGVPLSQPHLIAGGSTQMGKTMFVIIGYIAAWFAQCPLVCLTTTVSGTKSLHKKVLSAVARLEGCGAEGISYHCSYCSAATAAQLDYFKASISSEEAGVTAKGKKAPVRIGRDVVATAALGGSELAPDCGILFVADTAAQMSRAGTQFTCFYWYKSTNSDI